MTGVIHDREIECVVRHHLHSIYINEYRRFFLVIQSRKNNYLILKIYFFQYYTAFVDR